VIAVIPLFGLASSVRLWGSALVVLAIVSGVLWLYAEIKHTGRDVISAQPLADYGSNVSVRISYPTWLTADNIDIGERPDSQGGQVVVTVQGGTLAHFAFADNPLITIRDDEGKLFNEREITNPGEKFEVYLYVVDSSALISSTTTITPVIRTPDGVSSVTADELACPIELEPATWRSFRDVTKLVTTGAGAPGIIAILAALWTIAPEELKRLKLAL
jgi:hypothetical protein